jgi:hypothetical protein
MAVMARREAVISPGLHDLFKLAFSVISPGFRKPGLKVSAAAAAAVIVRSVGMHVNKILFTDNRFNHKSHVFGHGIAKALPDQLTWILQGKFNL